MQTGVGVVTIVCSLLTGCRTLTRQGPVPQSLVTCRQLTQQGINAMDRGDWKRSESLLARAVRSCSSDVDARRYYAETLCHRGAQGEALAQLEEARRLANEDPGLAVRTGELYLTLGRIDDARRMVDESLRLDPKFAQAWALRGRIASAQGQQRQALADYQRALGYAPADPSLSILVAEAYRQLNQPEDALLTLQSITDGFSRGEEPQQALFLQGLALTALGRYDDAAQLLELAARRDHATPDLLCHLAEAELLAGNFTKAQVAVQEALAIDPNHAGSRTLSARMAMAPPRSTTTR